MKFKRVFLTLILLMFLFPFAAYAAETDGEQLYYEQYYDSGADKLTDFLPDGTREYLSVGLRLGRLTVGTKRVFAYTGVFKKRG